MVEFYSRGWVLYPLSNLPILYQALKSIDPMITLPYEVNLHSPWGVCHAVEGSRPLQCTMPATVQTHVSINASRAQDPPHHHLSPPILLGASNSQVFFFEIRICTRLGILSNLERTRIVYNGINVACQCAHFTVLCPICLQGI